LKGTRLLHGLKHTCKYYYLLSNHVESDREFNKSFISQQSATD